jgi:S1-C subfamily serine protease
MALSLNSAPEYLERVSDRLTDAESLKTVGGSVGPASASRIRLVKVGALFTVVLVALLVAACGERTVTSSSVAASPTATSSIDTGAANLQNALVAVVQRVRSSVVQIQTNAGLGSGIVFDDKGDVVTNNHVVSGATEILVTTAEGKTQTASLIGTFPVGDLAVIRAPEPLRPATFADSSTLKVGMIVLAVGNPLGLQSSVTEGIVSAVDRTVSESGAITLPDMVQTSAAINPGNSGGALVDLAGNVVGIPTLTAVDPTLGAANGIGFAIPSNTVKDIATQIIANGHVVNSHRAYLGIRTSTVVNGTNSPVGVLVASVAPGGPAEKSGMMIGDIIIDLGETPIRTTTDLSAALAALQPGKVVTITVVTSAGAHKTLTATVAEIPTG